MSCKDIDKRINQLRRLGFEIKGGGHKHYMIYWPIGEKVSLFVTTYPTTTKDSHSIKNREARINRFMNRRKMNGTKKKNVSKKGKVNASL